MFATLELEHDPLRLHDFRHGTLSWLQDVGGFAGVALLIWLIYRLVRRRRPTEADEPRPAWHWVFLLALIGSFGCYLVYFGAQLPVYLESLMPGDNAAEPAGSLMTEYSQGRLLGLAGGLAILAASIMPLVNLFALRWRRIWAIARLSLKDAIRRKVLWVFLVLLVVFLFGSWFIDSKPENQVRSYVQVLYWVMTPLLLVTGGLLAAMSIPTDIKNQTIHTIITKPVERFEIVLGRFLGYAVLATGVLVAMTAFSLLYMLREIHPEARNESLKARVPVYGDELTFFEGNQPGFEILKPGGQNVGREWEYRQYIAGKAGRTQWAVWTFNELPAELGNRATVPVEYAFDIYRTTKGEQVTCSFTFRAWHEGSRRDQEKREGQCDQERLLERRNDPDYDAFLDDWLALKYGFFRSPSHKIVDYHTFSIDVPGALFKKPDQMAKEYEGQIARESDLPEAYVALVRPLRDELDPVRRLTKKQNLRSQIEREELSMTPEARKGAFLYREYPSLKQKMEMLAQQRLEEERPPLQIWVNCETRAQFIGMAKFDLYLLGANQPFWINFFKGAAGLWYMMLLVIGVAVALSTYLSGIISWITTMVLVLLGSIHEFLQQLSVGSLVGGGPMQSLFRLVNRQGVTVELGDSPALTMALKSDAAFQWLMRRFLNVIPNVERFSFTDYVAEGFNVPLVQLFLTLVLLVGYLVPVGLLAYYLMKWREVASST